MTGVERWQEAGFGLYVHWPFCQSKCPYCDFNSHVAATIDHDAWLSAYRSEFRRLRAETGQRRLSSIFFGGGTPSLMPERVVEGLIAEATSCWSAGNDIEITLEANPTSVEIDRFRGFREAGVNRVSIGVQALRDGDLRRLGRMHDAEEAQRAIGVAGSVFDRFSFDLIYARQDQSLADWEAELTEALAIGAGHMSLYQLTIEPGTIFGERHARGQLRGLPDEDLGADLYQMTQQLCEDAGLSAYEVSNHARAGQESRHNLIYWRSGDFAGVGPGAHGRLSLPGQGRLATEGHRAPGAWMASVAQTRSGESSRQQLTSEQVADEFLVMGLRLQQGVDLEELAAMTGVRPEASSLDALISMGMVSFDGAHLTATPAGRMVLNTVLQHISLLRVDEVRP